MVRVFSISYKMPLNAHPIYIYINHGKTDATFSDMMRIATQKNRQKSWKMSRFAGMNLLRSPC